MLGSAQTTGSETTVHQLALGQAAEAMDPCHKVAGRRAGTVVAQLRIGLRGEAGGAVVSPLARHPSGEPCLARAYYLKLREAWHGSLLDG